MSRPTPSYPTVSPMTDNRPVLLLIMAETCGGCIQFKKTILPSLETWIAREGKVRLIKKTLPNMDRNRFNTYLRESSPTDEPIPSGLVPEVIPYLEWFPNLLFITSNSWNRGNRLEATSYNGVYEKGKWVGKQEPPYTRDNIIQWINGMCSSQSKVSVSETPVPSSVAPVTPVPGTRFIPTAGPNYRLRHF